jgi:hypothetical protein
MGMVGKFKAVGRWGAIACATITAGVCIMAIPFNLAAERQEKVIQDEIDTLKLEADETAINYDKNTAATKLQYFTHDLGFDGISPKFANANYMKEKISVRNREHFDRIQENLQQYLTTESQKINRDFAPLPAQIQSYWFQNGSTLAQIRDLLRFYQQPIYIGSWDWVDNAQNTTVLPNEVQGLKDIHNLLLLDAIAQYRQGKTNLAFDSLDAAYQLALSTAKRVSPAEQAVYLDFVRQQALLLRKFDNLPPQFGERLVKDYHDAIAYSLQIKIVADFNVETRLPLDEQTHSAQASSYPAWLPQNGLFEQLAARHQAIALYQTQQAALQQVLANSSCQLNPETLTEDKTVTQLWQQATQLEQEIELTQLILQAKAIYAQNQQFPASLPNLASKACPGETWQYKLNSDGTASIQGVGNTAIVLEKSQN